MTLHPSIRTRRRRGSGLIVAIAMALPLLVAGGVLLGTVVSERTATEASVAIAQARDVAVSGAQDALAQLAVDSGFEGKYELALGGPLVTVSVTGWDSDGIDNDGNGVVDDAAEEPFISVRADGTTNVLFDAAGNILDRASRTANSAVSAVVEKVELDIPMNQALYVDDPLATFDLNGNAFVISGYDTNPDGTAGPDAPLPGIGTPGDPTHIASQISAAQEDNVQGAGGTPSVGTVDPFDLPGTMSALTPLASVVFNGPSDSFTGELGDVDTLDPIIVHAKGDLDISGNTSGCGILVVDGDLTLTGTFKYVGFILVSGAVTIKGGGGDKDIYGGLLTLGAVTGEGITLSGAVQIRYSSLALSTVETELSGGVTLVAWSQR